MKFHVLISAFLWLLIPIYAHATDPFSIIFGEEAIKLSRTNDANDDSITILKFKIRHHLISEDWVAYDLIDGLCVPIKPFSEALELPLELVDETFIGRLPYKEKTINFSIGGNSDLVKTDTGWCAFTSILEEVFAVTIDFRASNLELIITPKMMLPIDERLAREEIRRILKQDKVAQLPKYSLVENPYKFISPPTLDVSLDTDLSTSNDPKVSANISGAGDLFYMNAHFQSNSSLDGLFKTNRFRLFRDNPRPEELSFLKARQITFGDVSSVTQPLISKSGSGRGLLISNRPFFKPELFDETVIRGHLPLGWEAELFDGEVLIAFITEPNLNGEYVFKNVPLRPGFNHLTVKLFGPYGETSERPITQFVGPEHCPEKEWRYSFGLIDSSTSFLGESLIDTKLSESFLPLNAASTFLSLEHGLSKNLTLRGDLNIGKDWTAFSSSLITSVFDGYGVGRVALDSKGGIGWELNYQKRLTSETSFTSRYSQYGRLQSSVNGFGDSRLTRQLSGRLDTRLKLGPQVLPVQTGFNINQYANNLKALNASLRFAGTTRRIKWSNSLRYNQMFETGSTSGNLQGEALASYFIGGVKLRNSLNYDLSNGLTLNSVALSGRKKINRNSQFQAGLTYDMKAGLASIEGSYTQSFNRIALQTKAKTDQRGDWSLGVGLSFSLYHDNRKSSYRLARPGLSRTGVIAPRTFDDLNNNGVFDTDDITLSGTQFIVGNTLRSEKSDQSGINVIADLFPAKPINSEIKLSSIDDPFLRPIDLGRTLEPRAGQVLGYDVPLTATGEVEGVMRVINGDNGLPVAGIKLEALNSSGQVVGTTITEYDGYFYLEGVPATDLTLQVSTDDLNSISGELTPVIVSLSREKPSKVGLSLTIKPSLPKL